MSFSFQQTYSCSLNLKMEKEIKSKSVSFSGASDLLLEKGILDGSMSEIHPSEGF